MTIILCLLGALLYVGGGAWAFGFVRGATNDKENGWNKPAPALAFLMFPIIALVVGMIALMRPFQRMGFNYQRKKLEQKKVRVAEEKRLRVELAQIERELENEFEQLEDEQGVVPLLARKRQLR